MARRTRDVAPADATRTTFGDLLVPGELVERLRADGIVHASPVQVQALPLARAGRDLVVQAKSGTGKTLVFALAAIERVASLGDAARLPLVLIVAPTREIAVQIHDVVAALAPSGIRSHVFIGGLPEERDRRHLPHCQICIGTPGRLLALIEAQYLPVAELRMVVLDEADVLLADSFRSTTEAILGLVGPPGGRQTMAFSATYTPALVACAQSQMAAPESVRLCKDSPTLEGVRLYGQIVEGATPHAVYEAKRDHLVALLERVPFHQCVVFTNHQSHGQDLAQELTDAGWPARFMSGALPQRQRLAAIGSLRSFAVRVLVTTDVTARGIDVANVNLVVNLDVPRSAETFLHRVGRTGRFGSHGVAVTMLAGPDEKVALEEQIGADVAPLPTVIPREFLNQHIESKEHRQRLAEHGKTRKKRRRAVERRVAEEAEEEEEEEVGGQGEQWQQWQQWQQLQWQQLQWQQQWQQWQQAQAQQWGWGWGAGVNDADFCQCFCDCN